MRHRWRGFLHYRYPQYQTAERRRLVDAAVVSDVAGFHRVVTGGLWLKRDARAVARAVR